MNKVLSLCFFLSSVALHAQHDSLLAFLKKGYEQEKSWTSGEITITDYMLDGDSLIFSDSSLLTFFFPVGEDPLFLLEDNADGIYFMNMGQIEYAFRERRRQWYDLRFPDAYPNRFNYAFEELAINPFLKTDNNQPYIFVKNYIALGKDSCIHWNSEEGYLEIRQLQMQTDNMTNYLIWSFRFDSEGRVIEHHTYQEINAGDNVTMRPYNSSRAYSYAALNQVPYLNIMQKTRELRDLPLQTIFKPKAIEIESSPRIGEPFPNLILMNVQGDETHLSDILGPKVLIYFEINDFKPDSLFAFIDSLEDQFKGINFMLITQQNVDALYWLKRQNPTLNSFYLASKVEGLYLNGWPVWCMLDADNRLIGENHGFRPELKKEYIEWLKANSLEH